MTHFFLSIVSLLVPIAQASEITYSREIVVPPIEKHAMVTFSLPPDAREPRIETMIVSGGNATIRHEKSTTNNDVTSEATILAGPDAAATLPVTRITSLTDGDPVTLFQPVTSKQHTFLFSFPRIVTPTKLELQLQSGTLSRVSVRTGMTKDTLKNAYVGSTSFTAIPLSGETAKFIEITIEVGNGVLSIAELRILEPLSTITFRAAPGNEYTLYYGRGIRTPFVQEVHIPVTQRIDGTLGEPKIAVLSDDFDGVPVERDNCGGTWNPGQEDSDKDGIGSACDNCPMISNEKQEDMNGNGIGDPCDDDDNDSVQNSVDNCPKKSNRYQEDEDRDGIGNLCDDGDDRFSANKPWILWAVIGLIVVGLSGLTAMIFRRTTS